MPWWASVAAYSLVAAVLWRVWAGAIAWNTHVEEENPEPDVALGFWFGLIGAAFWPLVLVVLLAVKVGPSWPLVVGPERERRRFVREQRVREMERELGIDDPGDA